MSSGLASGAAATLMVSARSCAEMPVEIPSAASIEVVKLVPWRERFCSTIGRRPRRCACASVIGMQITEAHAQRLGLRPMVERSEEHTSELQSLAYLVCRLLLE